MEHLVVGRRGPLLRPYQRGCREASVTRRDGYRCPIAAQDSSPGRRRPPTLLRRVVWIPVGLVSVGVGGIGLVVPLLPSTVFFIIAAAAFARSSPRLENWVLGLPGVGRMVGDYRAGLGMPRRAKVLALSLLSVAVIVSALRLDGWVLPLVVLGVGAVGVVVILRTPTKRP